MIVVNCLVFLRLNLKKNMNKIIFAVSLIVISNFVIAKETRYPEIGNGRVEQQLVSATEYMVSSASPYASEVGLKILAKGGTAIDAAVAIQMVLNLVEPESSGIGGGAFSLYWDNHKKKLSSYDGREKAPMLADEKLFQQNGKNMNWWKALAGGRAVGVPGVVSMLEQIHQEHGRLRWSSLFTDAIKLAERGFEVSPKLAHSIANKTNRALGRYSEAQNYFFPNKKALKSGVIKKNPKLANTLKQISIFGSKAFYQGKIANNIVNAVRFANDNPGLLTLKDLSDYQSIKRSPICANYKAYEVCSMGPPTSGGISVIQILKLLEDKNLSQYGPTSLESVHLFSQAAKLAYADRDKYIADADFINVPIEGLIDETYLKNRAKLITSKDMGKAKAGNPANSNNNWLPAKSPEQPSTTHFSVIDKYGNGLSMTSSIEMAFGSTVMVDGFLLNNQLTDFSFSDMQNGKLIANRVQAGKRPRSSMSPFMIFDKNKKLVMLIGSPGGSRIINYVAKTIFGVLEWNLNIQDAINLPHYTNLNGATDLEKNTEIINLKDRLEKKGHIVNIRDLNSGLHGIVISTNGLFGGADPRRLGKVMGY